MGAFEGKIVTLLGLSNTFDNDFAIQYDDDSLEIGENYLVVEDDSMVDNTIRFDGMSSWIDINDVEINFELSHSKPEIKMGNSVKLISSEATAAEFGYLTAKDGYATPMVAVGETFIVGEVLPHSVIDSNGDYQYSKLDLELYIEEPEQEEETMVDIQAGDVVRWINDTSGREKVVYSLEENDSIVRYMSETGSPAGWDYLSDVEFVSRPEQERTEPYTIGDLIRMQMENTDDVDIDDGGPYYGLEEDWDEEEDEYDFDEDYEVDHFEVDELPMPEPEPEPEQGTFVVTQDSVTLVWRGVSDTIGKDNSNFDAAVEAVLNGRYDDAQGLMAPAKGIENWGQGALQIVEGRVSYNGMALTGKLVDRIVGMMGRGDESFEPLAKFLNLTMEQESFKTRERLMDFAAHDKLDINEDGMVIAFKNVNDNYMDKHSGTFRNMVGDAPSMRRSDVNDDHNQECSAGLHVCSPTYLQGFWGTSGRTMRVVVDPRDFVAIPYDYNDSKARVCKYKVVEDVTDRLASDFM